MSWRQANATLVATRSVCVGPGVKMDCMRSVIKAAMVTGVFAIVEFVCGICVGCRGVAGRFLRGGRLTIELPFLGGGVL